MRICVSIVCCDCKTDIGGKKTNYGLDGKGRCKECHKLSGKALYYFEEAIVIGDDRDFEDMANSSGASIADGTMGDICDFDSDREEVFMFVGDRESLASLMCKLEGKQHRNKNSRKKQYEFIHKMKLKDAKRYSPA